MICEFAVTPQIFDEEANASDPAWLEHIRELGRSLLPRTGIHAVMLANLYGGSWEHETKNMVAAIRDQAARLLAQSLLKQIKDSYLPVNRPPVGDWPDTETGWANEAVASSASSADAPISRILVTESAHGAMSPPVANWTAIGRIHHDGCWSDAQPWRSVPMNLNAQVSVLRTVICHAGFISVATPHVYGGTDDETEFIRRLVRAMQSRPFHTAEPLVDIHTETPDKPTASDYPRRLQNRIANIATAITEVKTTARVRLFLWAQLLDRHILAGDVDATGGVLELGRCRWAITPQHIARPGDPPTLAPTPWSLVPSRSIQAILDRFYGRRPTAGPYDL